MMMGNAMTQNKHSPLLSMVFLEYNWLYVIFKHVTVKAWSLIYLVSCNERKLDFSCPKQSHHNFGSSRLYDICIHFGFPLKYCSFKPLDPVLHQFTTDVLIFSVLAMELLCGHAYGSL
jgi:hypothetical protein